MELSKNMYVRTKTKGIGKIISLTWCDDDECCLIEIAQNHRTGIRHHNIIKASYNIIDLIEEGDYVNGHKVQRHLGELMVMYEIENKIIPVNINDKHFLLESIVTHEQFESMEYKVKENK